jgi:asparagine N-glycosylation enzyme membrane subunit Stt3
MQSFEWATTWPPMCLIICVTIVYSVIQPVITALTLVAMILMYAAYKYTMYWCADQPDMLETGGLFYIKALRTVFVSLYLEGVCLAGLFFLSTDASGGRTPTGLACGALMVSRAAISHDSLDPC